MVGWLGDDKEAVYALEALLKTVKRGVEGGR